MTTRTNHTDVILAQVREGAPLTFLGNFYARAQIAERNGRGQPEWNVIDETIKRAHKADGLSLVRFRADLIGRGLVIPARGVVA